jgi:peptidoglycan/LPS O-acetylase OafA/YrhL
METRELQSLTPLRGIAAVWVICFHYAVTYFAFRPGLLGCIFGKGYLAVDMFFMLSGFVLSHVYWHTFTSYAADRSGDYWTFIGARVARIYPLHLFNLCQFLIAALAFGIYHYLSVGRFDAIPFLGARSLTALVANLAMLQGLEAEQLSWNYPAWSISIEFLAYFLFPLVLPLIAAANGRQKALIGGIALSILGIFAYLANGDFNQWDGPITLLRCLPEFIFGALLYAGFQESLWSDWFKKDCAIAAIVCGEFVLIYFRFPDLVVVAGFLAVILSAVMNSGRLGLFLNAAPLVWLGEISYSLYLAHGFVQFLTTQALISIGIQDASKLSATHSVELLLAMVGATLVMAVFTHRDVEISSRSRLRRLLRPRSEYSPGRCEPQSMTAGLRGVKLGAREAVLQSIERRVFSR